MRIENVGGMIWDLDGTLLDSFHIFEKVIADIVAESGNMMPSQEYMLENYHGSLKESIERVLAIQSAAELDAIVETFLQKQENYYADNLETHLFQDAVKLAQQAANLGIQQLLVTNREHKGRIAASPLAIVAATTLVDYIHEVRPGDHVEFRKPDKRSAIDWVEKHDLSPTEVLVIGDQHVDAQLALNLCARALLIRRSGNIPHLDTLPDIRHIIEVDSLEDIELSR